MRRRPAHEEKDQEQRQADGLENERGGIGHHDEKLAAKCQLANHRRILDDAGRRSHHALVDPQPREQSRDQEEDVVIVAGPRAAAEQIRENEPVEHHQTQRLQHGPEKAEGRPCKAGGKVAFHELAEEMDVPVREGSSGLDRTG